eukprot:scaffold73185_cov31-Tisochrysis_lutea.AAC.1
MGQTSHSRNSEQHKRLRQHAAAPDKPPPLLYGAHGALACEATGALILELLDRERPTRARGGIGRRLFAGGLPTKLYCGWHVVVDGERGEGSAQQLTARMRLDRARRPLLPRLPICLLTRLGWSAE